MASALTAEQRWALITAYGSIDNARDEAIGRSLELQELWQSQFTGDWGRGSGFEEVFWARALPVLGIDLKRKGGRPKGSFVEAETFWTVWAMVLNENASAREIAKATDDADSELEFVNRDKAGVIVKAVRSNRTAARAALAGRKTPPGFSATLYGIKLPMPKAV